MNTCELVNQSENKLPYNTLGENVIWALRTSRDKWLSVSDIANLLGFPMNSKEEILKSEGTVRCELGRNWNGTNKVMQIFMARRKNVKSFEYKLVKGWDCSIEDLCHIARTSWIY